MVNALNVSSLGRLNTSEGIELSQRLETYQAFLKIYERHRGLLDEILELEDASGKSLATVGLHYLQGIVKDQQVYLTTNLLGGKTHALVQSQRIWTIGRDSRQVGLPILDKQLSRCHAAIKYVEHQGFYLIDLESSNGSFVNGERIQQPHRLKDGDRLRLGSLTITFFLCSASEELAQLTPELFTRIQQLEHCVPSPESTPAKASVAFASKQLGANDLPADKTLLLSRSDLWKGKPMILPPED
jgi:pSer/pThr/pTyr-binding forkhead associated (FHA) protein